MKALFILFLLISLFIYICIRKKIIAVKVYDTEKKIVQLLNSNLMMKENWDKISEIDFQYISEIQYKENNCSFKIVQKLGDSTKEVKKMVINSLESEMNNTLNQPAIIISFSAISITIVSVLLEWVNKENQNLAISIFWLFVMFIFTIIIYSLYTSEKKQRRIINTINKLQY